MTVNSAVDWILLNLPFLIAMAFFILFCVRAIKDGFVNELFSFICAIIATFAIALLAIAVHGVFDNQRIQFVIAIVLLILLGIIKKMLNLLFSPIKLAAKLPIVKIIDKVVGIVMAALEAILLVWAVYCVVIIVGAGSMGDWILRCVRANPLMKALYEYNYLYSLVSSVSSKLQGIDVWGMLGM